MSNWVNRDALLPVSWTMTRMTKAILAASPSEPLSYDLDEVEI